MDENEVDITLFELLLSSADTKSKIFPAAHNPRDEAQDRGIKKLRRDTARRQLSQTGQRDIPWHITS